MAERRPFFPGRYNAPPQRGMERGGARFGISAPPRPGGTVATPDRTTTTPTIPRPDTTPKPAPEQRPEKGKKHTGRNIALAGTAGLGVLGAGLYAGYETIPAFHQMVDNAFPSHLR